MPSQEELVAYRDDRRFRELYRYFQPAGPAAVLYQPDVSVTEESAVLEHASSIIPTVESNGNPPAGSLVPLGEDPASPNTILSSFAQLATHRVNAEWAIIW